MTDETKTEARALDLDAIEARKEAAWRPGCWNIEAAREHLKTQYEPGQNVWESFEHLRMGIDDAQDDVDALTAEVRKLREALADSVPKHVAWDNSCKVPPKTESEIAAVFEPIIAHLTNDDIMVFQGAVTRPGYPRGESTERLVAAGLLVDFATNTPLGALFQSYLNRQHSGAAQALKGTQP